jgi:hypothetical protein
MIRQDPRLLSGPALGILWLCNIIYILGVLLLLYQYFMSMNCNGTLFGYYWVVDLLCGVLVIQHLSFLSCYPNFLWIVQSNG